jgi:hypothetical protein
VVILSDTFYEFADAADAPARLSDAVLPPAGDRTPRGFVRAYVLRMPDQKRRR